MDYTEGRLRKGGTNLKPSTPQPPPPLGQGLGELIDNLRGRNIRLVIALNKYGEHLASCNFSPCDCGLRQILKEVKGWK